MSTGANDPLGLRVTGCDSGQFEPQGHIWIYIVNHYALLHTSKYSVCFMDSLRIKNSFPHYKSVEANNSQGVANLDPRGMAGMI